MSCEFLNDSIGVPNESIKSAIDFLRGSINPPTSLEPAGPGAKLLLGAAVSVPQATTAAPQAAR